MLSKLEIIEDKMYQDNIQIFNTSTSKVGAASIKYENEYSIFVDKTKLETRAEHYTAIAHEYYHIRSDAFYTFDDSLQTRKRREYKANKAMAIDLVPIDKLRELIQKSYLKNEIADEFDITEEFLDEALRIYKNMGEL